MACVRFLVVMGLLAAGGVGRAAAPVPRRDLSAKEGMLKVGDPAPDFTLKDVDGKRSVRLAGLKGKPVVLFFGSCT
jgi:cytochrome oxidase Cu insertion factor (SCO1/SenC/PrrC family)